MPSARSGPRRAKFRRRWAAIEEAAFAAGIPVENLTTEQLNAMWDAVKEAERSEGAGAA